MVAAGKVPHAIMFHEDDGGGAMAFCLAFLELLFGSPKVSRMIHMDVHYSFPCTGGLSEPFLPQWKDLVLSNPYFTENEFNEALGFESKSAIIAVPEAKAILSTLAFNPLEGGYRAVVVYLPEKMNADAANRLLKAIEEPEGRTQLLFITHSPDKVLSTISSRCLRIRLVPDNNVKGNEYLGPQMDLFRSLMDALLAKDLSTALEVGEELAALKSREKMKSFCRLAGTAFRDIFMIQQGLPQLSTGGGGEYLQELAAKCKKTFPRKAQAVIDRANMLIDRNVNQKILFSDMVDRLFVMI
jgi:DNA polymerase-3 subunit delta'